jgi:hypothetical protein
LFSAASGKRKFVFFGQQTINGKRRSLFQQTCPSMEICPLFIIIQYYRWFNSSHPPPFGTDAKRRRQYFNMRTRVWPQLIWKTNPLFAVGGHYNITLSLFYLISKPSVHSK